MDTKKSGFSIIEVALVLGIAGLIFIMAFIALPSLQASQRDADRKARVMEFISDVKTYQTNNSRGALPILSAEKIEFKMSDPNARTEHTQGWYDFVKDYVLPGKDFVDASGNEYSYVVAKCNDPKCAELNPANGDSVDTIKADSKIYVAIGATCDGDRMVKANSNRSVAAIQILERAGRYCYNT